MAPPICSKSLDFLSFSASSENFCTFAVGKDKGFELGPPNLQMPPRPLVNCLNEAIESATHNSLCYSSY